MRNIYLFCALALIFSSLSAQIVQKPPPMPDPELACNCMGNCYEDFVEEMPYLFDSSYLEMDYQDAQRAASIKLLKFIKSEIQYPSLALLYGIEGNVYIRFGVNARGDIDRNSIKILKGVDPTLDREALRIAYLLAEKKWVPAKSKYYCPAVRDYTVNAYFTFPFRFKLP